MALDTATKKDILTQYATTEGDTGSPETQVRCSRAASTISPST